LKAVTVAGLGQRVVLVAAIAVSGCARAPTRVAREPAGAPAIRVMTYNVNFGIPGDPPTIAAIASGHADVVFLQETTPEWEEALRAALGKDYPNVFFRHWSGSGGLGVLSRLPIKTTKIIYPEGEGWFPALRLVLDAPFGPLQVLVVHLRPPVTDGGSYVVGHFIIPKIHEAEIAHFTDDLDPSLPTLVAGDFNEEDGKALAYLGTLHMRSALPEFAPGRITWRWETSFATFERRFDHVVYDTRLEPLAMEVLDAGNSDHFPVVGLFAPVGAKRERPAAGQRR
jgi:endonuclease/exonuclease/phosphatase (EEP) superfamily protein YafD